MVARPFTELLGGWQCFPPQQEEAEPVQVLPGERHPRHSTLGL